MIENLKQKPNMVLAALFIIIIIAILLFYQPPVEPDYPPYTYSTKDQNLSGEIPENLDLHEGFRNNALISFTA